MHATALVGINGITRVLLVYTYQQGVRPRGHILPLWLPLCPPQTPNRLCRERTRASAVRNWRLIAWAMARHRRRLGCSLCPRLSELLRVVWADTLLWRADFMSKKPYRESKWFHSFRTNSESKQTRNPNPWKVISNRPEWYFALYNSCCVISII
jgi:hypothetical protein